MDKEDFDVQIDEIAKKRLKNHLENKTSLIDQKDVLGDALDKIKIDKDDGWE